MSYRNLIVLTLALLLSVPGARAQEEGLVAHWSFDAASGRFVKELVTGRTQIITSPYHEPERVEGIDGQALRFDGYSTWVTTNVPDSLEPRGGLTTMAWVALKAYPVTNAPIVNQYTFPDAGYFFGMDKYGAWYLAVSIEGQWYTCWGAAPFPKDEWVHVAGTFDAEAGEMRVYLNGRLSGTQSVPGRPITPEENERLTLGRNVHPEMIGPFETGLLNAAMDEVKVYRRALSSSSIYSAAQVRDVPRDPDLDIPPTRFAGDLHRPAYHPIPPGNWTNEPHGLVYHDGAYHLFYQHNPNGPYWEQIHWGHLKSEDLVVWEPQPLALAPRPGYDQRGIWSGDAVVNDGELTLVYTGVDGVKAVVALAMQQPDGSFTRYEGNPVIGGRPGGYDDFRDPYVWQHEGVWYLTIGAGIAGGGGGVALLYASNDLVNWAFRGRLHEGNPARSGTFWEMPLMVPLTDVKYALLITTIEEGPARALYWIGTFDGRRFVPDHDAPKQLDLINHLLSPAVGPGPEGRMTAVGIVSERRSSEQQLEAGWAHLYSLPRIWTLEDGEIAQAPAPELRRLRDRHMQRADFDITATGSGYIQHIGGRQLEIDVTLDPGDATTVGLRLLRSPGGEEETRLYYHAGLGTINLDLTRSSLSGGVETSIKSAELDTEEGQPLRLHVFVDHSVMDVFVNGRDAFSARVYPSMAESDGIDLYASGGTAHVEKLDVWTMKSQADVELSSGPRKPAAVPGQVGLGDPYPNPFDEQVSIPYTVAEAGAVRVSIYDTLGRRVRTLVDALQVPGAHQARWDGRDASGQPVASGVYVCRLQANDHARTQTLVHLR